MPSGYTAPIYEDQPITFRDFALRCSCGMGAQIMQRDESLDVAPEERQVASYYQERVERAEARILELRSRTAHDWSSQWEADRTEAVAALQASRERSNALRARYDAMIAEVEVWEPPTEEHAGLKRFMLDQLNESRKFDAPAMLDSDERPWPTLEQYESQEIERAHTELERARTSLEEEQERAEGAAKWLRDLVASLPPATE